MGVFHVFKLYKWYQITQCITDISSCFSFLYRSHPKCLFSLTLFFKVNIKWFMLCVNSKNVIRDLRYPLKGNNIWLKFDWETRGPLTWNNPIYVQKRYKSSNFFKTLQYQGKLYKGLLSALYPFYTYVPFLTWDGIERNRPHMFWGIVKRQVKNWNQLSFQWKLTARV